MILAARFRASSSERSDFSFAGPPSRLLHHSNPSPFPASVRPQLLPNSALSFAAIYSDLFAASYDCQACYESKVIPALSLSLRPLFAFYLHNPTHLQCRTTHCFLTYDPFMYSPYVLAFRHQRRAKLEALRKPREPSALFHSTNG